MKNLDQIKHEKEESDARLYEMALPLVEFIMGMGCWLFTGKDGYHVVSRDRLPAYAKSFTHMMDEFDN